MPIHPNVPRCKYIKTNGVRCGSPSLRGHDRCYFHHRVEIEVGAQVPGTGTSMPPLEDEASIQLSLMRVMDDIRHGRLDARRAHLTIWALQLATFNVNRLDLDKRAIRNQMVRTLPANDCTRWSPYAPAHLRPIAGSRVGGKT